MIRYESHQVIYFLVCTDFDNLVVINDNEAHIQRFELMVRSIASFIQVSRYGILKPPFDGKVNV